MNEMKTLVAFLLLTSSVQLSAQSMRSNPKLRTKTTSLDSVTQGTQLQGATRARIQTGSPTHPQPKKAVQARSAAVEMNEAAAPVAAKNAGSKKGVTLRHR